MPLFLLGLWTWLRRAAAAIPAWAYALAALAAALAWEAHAAHREHKARVVAETSLASVVSVQRAVNAAAVANKARVEVAQVALTKETTDANDHAHAVAGDAATALRVRIADLERAARARAVSSPAGSAGIADAQVDLRLPLADELALRNQCEGQRIDRDSLIDWVAAQAAVDRGPTP